MGSAEAAKRDAWERVSADPSYLCSLAVDHARQFDETKQLEMLLWLAPGSDLKKELGFDPRERLASSRESLRLLTPRQGVAAAVGFAILVLLLLFPPWIRQSDDVTRLLLSQRSREVLAKRSLGYQFLFTKFPPDKIEHRATGDLGVTRLKRTRTIVQKGKLMLPMPFVILGSCIAIAFLRSSPRRAGP